MITKQVLLLLSTDQKYNLRLSDKKSVAFSQLVNTKVYDSESSKYE